MTWTDFVIGFFVTMGVLTALMFGIWIWAGAISGDEVDLYILEDHPGEEVIRVEDKRGGAI